MTTVRDRGPAPDWLPTLQGQLVRARDLLGGASPNRADADRAGQALRQTSDALSAVLLECGVETPLGWRLHHLRSQLEAHLLAASALADADAGDAVINVLRRSLDLVEPELEALGSAAIASSGG